MMDISRILKTRHWFQSCTIKSKTKAFIFDENVSDMLFLRLLDL